MSLWIWKYQLHGMATWNLLGKFFLFWCIYIFPNSFLLLVAILAFLHTIFIITRISFDREMAVWKQLSTIPALYSYYALKNAQTLKAQPPWLQLSSKVFRNEQISLLNCFVRHSISYCKSIFVAFSIFSSFRDASPRYPTPHSKFIVFPLFSTI